MPGLARSVAGLGWEGTHSPLLRRRGLFAIRGYQLHGVCKKNCLSERKYLIHGKSSILSVVCCLSGARRLTPYIHAFTGSRPWHRDKPPRFSYLRLSRPLSINFRHRESNSQHRAQPTVPPLVNNQRATPRPAFFPSALFEPHRNHVCRPGSEAAVSAKGAVAGMSTIPIPIPIVSLQTGMRNSPVQAHSMIRKADRPRTAVPPAPAPGQPVLGLQLPRVRQAPHTGRVPRE